MGADLVIDTVVNSPQIVGLGGYPTDSMLGYVLGVARGPKVLYVGTADIENPYAALDSHERLVREAFPPGIALDDAAGAHFVGTELHAVVASSPTARGYRVGPDGELPLETHLL